MTTGTQARVTARMDELPAFPHCDSLVLHAPGECVYCDKQPTLQALRVELGINFTGHDDPDKEPCPAEKRRKRETINRWPGNVARPNGFQGVESW